MGGTLASLANLATLEGGNDADVSSNYVTQSGSQDGAYLHQGGCGPGWPSHESYNNALQYSFCLDTSRYGYGEDAPSACYQIEFYIDYVDTYTITLTIIGYTITTLIPPNLLFLVRMHLPVAADLD